MNHTIGSPAVKRILLHVRVKRGVLHEGDPLAFDGVRDDCQRFSPAFSSMECPMKGTNIMPVAPGHGPTEGAKLRRQIPQVRNFGNIGVGLHLVVVDHHSELFHPVVHGGRKGFPDLSLLKFPIPGQDKDPSLATRKPPGQDHPLGLGNPHAQRPGVGMDPGQPDLGVAGQTLESAKTTEQCIFDFSQSSQNCVMAGGIVTL